LRETSAQVRGSVVAFSGDVDGDNPGVRVAEDAGPGAVARVSAGCRGPCGENAGGVGDRGLQAEECGFVRIGHNRVASQGEENHQEEKVH